MADTGTNAMQAPGKEFDMSKFAQTLEQIGNNPNGLDSAEDLCEAIPVNPEISEIINETHSEAGEQAPENSESFSDALIKVEMDFVRGDIESIIKGLIAVCEAHKGFDPRILLRRIQSAIQGEGGVTVKKGFLVSLISEYYLSEISREIGALHNTLNDKPEWAE